jgi:N-acetyl-anhydromuramoyl-L-alanine amidase
MKVKKDHWLARVRKKPSANCAPRPDHADISLLVIHNISLPPGKFGTGMVEELFLNRLDITAHPALADLAGVRVSAHLLIERSGRTTQFVPFDQAAWHAGESQWRGCTGCNDFAIGIELEGSDDRKYTGAQYRRLHQITEALLARYPRLSPEAIVGHQEIAPLRKSDPGPAFDWRRYLGAVSPRYRD